MTSLELHAANGKVRGGAPVTYAEVGRRLGLSRHTVRRYFHRLARLGYLQCKATPRGVKSVVCNQKKFRPDRQGRFFIVSSGLLDPKHLLPIGPSLSVFMWCIDEQSPPEGSRYDHSERSYLQRGGSRYDHSERSHLQQGGSRYDHPSDLKNNNKQRQEISLSQDRDPRLQFLLQARRKNPEHGRRMFDHVTRDWSPESRAAMQRDLEAFDRKEVSDA